MRDFGDGDDLFDTVHASSRSTERGQHRFPEITGLCRTCKHAHITRQEYDEAPRVICRAVYERAHRVPLDITECSSYRRSGEMNLRELTNLAILIDPRDRGGQYI